MTVEGAMRSPLRGRTLPSGLRELPFLAQVSIRADAAPPLPAGPNTWTSDGQRELLWLGPDEWLAVSPPGTAGDTLAAFAGRAHALVDVSANRVVLELEGDDRLEVLSQGCGLDLHPRAWRSGMCAQTLLAHVPVVLQERGDATRVLVRPSFAGHLADWLAAVTSA